MKSGFYCVIASAKLQSQRVWMCIHVYLNNATGGSAAWCIQSDLLLSGFWATALMRLHIDQSVSWSVFHRLLSGYKGSGLFYVHNVSTWRRVGMKPELHVMIPKCIGETCFSCIHPKPEKSASWIGSRLSGFAFNPRDLCTLILSFHQGWQKYL